MLIRRALSLLVVVSGLLVGLLVACGSPTGDGGPGAGEPVTARLGPAGGSVQADANDGSSFLLEVPAGALNAELDVTVTPMGGSEDRLASFGVEPRGLWFEAPVTLSLTLADASDVSGDVTLALASDGGWVHVPTERDAATGRLTALVPVLSPDPDLTLYAGDPGAVRQAGAGLAPAQAGGDGVAAVLADCRKRLDNADNVLQILLAKSTFQRALEFSYATAVLANDCTFDDEYVAWLQAVPEIACARYGDLVLVARTSAADDYGVFTELMAPIFSFTAVLHELGITECEGQPDWSEVYDEKIDQLLTFTEATIAADFEAEFDELLVEAVRLWQLRTETWLLGLTDAGAAIQTRGLFPMLDRLRAEGYELCRATDTHFYLASLLEREFVTRNVPIGSHALMPLSSHAGFSDGDLHLDLQYCASSMEVHVWTDPDVPTELTEQARELAGGTAPGQFMDSATTFVPTQGHLVVSGDVAQFRCPGGVAADSLTYLFDSHEVGTSEASGDTLMTAPKEFSIEELAETAGFTPGAFASGSLVVRRDGDACGGLFGPAPFDLFMLDLSLDPAPSMSGLTASRTSLAAHESTEVTFTMPFRDDGENIMFVIFNRQFNGRHTQNSEYWAKHSEFAEGFDVAHGVGTFTYALGGYCSHPGENPLTVTMHLWDELYQVSEKHSVDITVNYAGCEE